MSALIKVAIIQLTKTVALNSTIESIRDKSPIDAKSVIRVLVRKESSKLTRTRVSGARPTNVKNMGAHKHLQTKLVLISTSKGPTSGETNLVITMPRAYSEFYKIYFFQIDIFN